MRFQRKGDKCLNCGESLKPEDNYCPVCGQLNDDPNIPFKDLVYDFLSNYFSLDSRFSRSILPFLFRPGYLTNRFIEGKRVSYANPIRLYLIVSVIYFFLLSVVATDVTETYSSMQSNTTEEFIQMMDSTDREEFKRVQEESSGKLIQMDFGEDSLDNSKFENAWQKYQKLKKSDDLSTNELTDKVITEDFSWWEARIIRQFIKIDNSDVTSVTAYLIKNASIMMFVLLPIFALALKLVYIRRKNFLYFHHLIHSIHLHSFAFFIFSLIPLMDLVWGVDIDAPALILFVVYIFFSLKMVYRQGYFKTAVKQFTLFLMYGSAFAVGLVIEVLISLLIF